MAPLSCERLGTMHTVALPRAEAMRAQVLRVAVRGRRSLVHSRSFEVHPLEQLLEPRLRTERIQVGSDLDQVDGKALFVHARLEAAQGTVLVADSEIGDRLADPMDRHTRVVLQLR